MRISRFSFLTLFLAARCFSVPISFEQRDSRHFLARFANRSAVLQPDRVVLADVTLRFPGAAQAARLEGLGQAAPSTYLRAGFSRTFPQFPKLAIHNLYPGVDAVFYGSGENLEYDLKIASGVSRDRIRISLDGARNIRLDDQGNLAIETGSGVLQQMRPRVFQRNREISARYVLLGANEVAIRLGKHDHRSPLTIDPVLSYLKTYGQSGSSSANLIATDSQGNIYAAGQSNSADFPTTSNSFDPTITPPLVVVANTGKTISSLRVGASRTVSVVGGTQDGTILYASTPDGILLSADSGATWQQTAPLLAGNTSVTVNSIALDPLDAATVMVATNAGVFGTDSHGEFWGAHNTGFPVSASGSVAVSSAFYSPVNPLIAYATTSFPALLFASADAGGTWTQLNPTYPGEPPPPTLPFPPIAATISPDGSTLYVVNGNGILLKSGDGGKSWVKLAQGLVNSTMIQLDPSNSSTLYVLDQQGLQKSTDGGLTFSSVTAPATIQKFTVDSSGALYISSTNFVYMSTDGGNTFTAVPHLTSYDITALTALDGKVYVGSLTPSVPFVIKLDPAGNILYSTFLGGSSGDGATGLAVDSQGNAVLVGYALSPDFPLTLPTSNPPSFSKTEGFIAKLSADGTHLIYSRVLGGSKSASIQAVALDAAGNVYITGTAFSADFPTTANVFQPSLPTTSCPRPSGGGILPIANLGGYAFVTKVNADGSLVYSTFLAGSCGSFGEGITMDSAGDAIVVGYTTSPDFPVSANAYQPKFPGPSDQILPPGVLDAGFITKLSPSGDKILASSYLGGGYTTNARAVALDATGNAYITGSTQGFASGATPGAYRTTFVDRCTPSLSIGPSVPYTGTTDAFILKLDPAFSSARFLSYLGGACGDSGNTLALDAAGDVWVSGTTQSPDFPLKDPFQANAVFQIPGFVTELSPDASQVLFSSLSSGAALALTPAAVYLAGSTGNSATVAKIDPTTTPAVHIDSVSPVVAFPPTSIQPFSPGIVPGQLVQITGRNLGPATKVNAQLDATGRLPFILGDTIVFFDNIPAPLISVQASSIQCFAPFGVSSTTQVTVLFDGQRSNAVRMGVSSSAPQILSIGNQDGTANSADHPAKAGSVISLYVSGLGATSPPSDDGLVNATPLPVPLVPVMVYLPVPPPSITPQSVSAAPGMIAGISQVNVQLPLAISTTPGTTKITITLNSANAPLYVTQ